MPVQENWVPSQQIAVTPIPSGSLGVNVNGVLYYRMSGDLAVPITLPALRLNVQFNVNAGASQTLLTPTAGKRLWLRWLKIDWQAGQIFDLYFGAFLYIHNTFGNAFSQYAAQQQFPMPQEGFMAPNINDVLGITNRGGAAGQVVVNGTYLEI